MVRPIVALLTDFGTPDHYAGAMKGVVPGPLEVFLDGRSADVEAAGRPIGPIVGPCIEVPSGRACALVGSGDRLEIACNRGIAHETLGLDRGAVVRVGRRIEPAPPTL